MRDQNLLIFPCSASKEGVGLPRPLPMAFIKDFISREAAIDLADARDRVFRDKRLKTSIDLDSPPVQALGLYTGTQYKVPGFKDRVADAIRAGLHCIIISGGYGLVRADEPIHSYEAEVTRTRDYWKNAIPTALAEYILRNQIGRVFVASSSSYVGILKKKGWSGDAKVFWCIPKLPTGEGGAMYWVPRLTGERVVELIDAGYVPGRLWTIRWPE